MGIITPVAFIDRLVRRNELGQPFKLLPFQREIFNLGFQFDSKGRLLYDTYIYSCPKKSGKTTLNGAMGLYWGFVMEAPNEIKTLANDLEQSLSRVFATMEGIIKFNPELQREAEVQQRTIYLANGTTITALSGDFAGSAGSNHGFVSYDELWGYTSESSIRLWEELTPVPTRRNSVRFITTYAGFEGESKLLWDLYKQVVSTDEHPEGQGERIHPDLPIFANREARIFCYWDHEPRMPWQTKEYYDSQKRTLRPGAYLRFHQNQWATAEEAFITAEMWDPCVDRSHRPTTMARLPLFVGIDVGIKHDNAARVAVRWDEAGEKLILVSHRIWKPTPTQPLDLENTVEEDLRNLNDQCDLGECWADPYQFHRSITTLAAAGLPIKEFPQTTANCTLMGQTVFDLLNGQNIVLYPSDELRQQALSTVAIENVRGWRIAKEKASRKIDAIIALAMACCAAMVHRGSRRRFDRERLRAMLQAACEPNFRGMLHDSSDNILHIRLEENSAGPVSMWNAPESNRSYVIGAHGGIESSCAYVLERGDLSICAEFHGSRIDQDRFAEEVVRLAKTYNTALIGTEDDDNPTYQALLRLGYPRLYRHRHDEHFVKSSWLAAAADDLSALLRQGFNCPARELIVELLTVTVKDNGQVELQNKGRTTAAAIAMRVQATSGLQSIYPSLLRKRPEQPPAGAETNRG
jgi:phage terminase large subunit-like protein